MSSKPIVSMLAAGSAAVVLLAGASAHSDTRAAAKPALAPNQWAQEASDLKPDPNIRFGKLPNGMTYALMRNQTPTGQASFRLRIAAGSMMETDAQQGLAHFLEHMAFNGSTHVPTGEMVKILERHGLAFGADTNASTGWDETIFKLDLPKTDADTVDTSLFLLREIAGELQIPQAAMDRERGVVLSEERLDDSPGYRASKSRIQFIIPGQLAAHRLPIGQVDVIKNAPRSAIVDYYEKYYRPERATLVAVGDFDLDAMEAKIKAKFGGWVNTHPAGSEPELGLPGQRPSEAKVIVEPGAPLSLQVAWLSPPNTAPETEALDRKETAEGLALSVLNRRLGRITREANPPFISAAAGSGDFAHSAKLATLHVTAQPDAWKPALEAVEHEERRLVQYGVLKSELDREIDDMRTGLREHVASAATRSTPSMADMISGSMSDREVVQSPEQDLAQFEREVKTITPEEISAAAKEIFVGSGPLLFMSSPKPLDGGAEVLKTAYENDRAQAVIAPTMVADKSWPYQTFGHAGRVVERRNGEFGAVMVRFQNGVRLTVKPTTYHRSEADVQVRFGGGRLDLSKTAPSAVWASSAFIEGGLKKLTAEDIDQVMTNKVVGANLSLDDDAFSLSGAAKSSDLDAQMQLLAAYVTDPGFRPEAFERMRTYGMTLNNQMEATPMGVEHRDLAQLLHSGDQRWATPNTDFIASTKLTDLKALLTDHLDHGPIEVLIVGDVSVDQAIAATAQTFGAMNRAAEIEKAPADGRAVVFPKAVVQPIVERHKGRADQAVAVLAWPTNDFYANMREARVLTVLSQIVQMRMLDDLRAQKGDTYSPSAGENPSLIYPGYGYLYANVETPPGKVEGFFTEVQKIAADLRAQPIAKDELDRAVLPLVSQLQQARETNGYWMANLVGAQTDPRRFESVRTQIAQYQGVTAADLQKAAQKYLDPNKAWKYAVLPEQTVADAAPLDPAKATIAK